MNRDDVDLVAGNALALVLEDQVFVVCRPICLGILSTEGKLANVPKMLFGGRRERGRRGWHRLLSTGVQQSKTDSDKKCESWFPHRSSQLVRIAERTSSGLQLLSILGTAFSPTRKA